MSKKEQFNFLNFQRIESAINYIIKNQGRNLSLSEVASSVGLSEFHFQRLFKKWAGISPKNLMQYLTLEKAKERLDLGKDVLSTSESLGLSGPGRLHDVFVKIQAMSPGEYKLKGLGIKIFYGKALTPFGYALIAYTDRGICHIHFFKNTYEKHLKELFSRFNNASFIENQSEVDKLVKKIFSGKKQRLSLFLVGTSFQIKVWEALLKIPYGEVVTYQQVAQAAGNIKASRAVGTAIGSNQIALLIPCHRAIRSSGALGDYRWGIEKKQSILCFESTNKK